jgi:hypothetical protein
MLPRARTAGGSSARLRSSRAVRLGGPPGPAHAAHQLKPDGVGDDGRAMASEPLNSTQAGRHPAGPRAQCRCLPGPRWSRAAVNVAADQPLPEEPKCPILLINHAHAGPPEDLSHRPCRQPHSPSPQRYWVCEGEGGGRVRQQGEEIGTQEPQRDDAGERRRRPGQDDEHQPDADRS